MPRGSAKPGLSYAGESTTIESGSGREASGKLLNLQPFCEPLIEFG